MIQLTFQAALDSHHAMFRLIRLRPLLLAVRELSVDQVRIIDFYLTFPFRVDAIRLQPNHRRFKRLAEEYANRRHYGEQPDDQALFNRMEPMQVAAMETLAANGYLESSRLRASWIRPTTVEPALPLVLRAQYLNKEDQSLVDFLQILATEYKVLGPNGLKSRTGLMEYRYDAV